MKKLTTYLASGLILVLSAVACSPNTPGTEAGKIPAKPVAAASPAARIQPQAKGVAAVFSPFYVYQDKSSRNR